MSTQYSKPGRKVKAMPGIKFNFEQYQLIVVGCGGTGSALLYFLSRFLFNLNKNVLVTLVDGDTVEAKNVTRQSFVPGDIGENKARVLSNRYLNLLGLQMSYSDKYIETSDDLWDLIYNNRIPIIVGCLDNTLVRFHLNECFKKLYVGAYLDAGNAEHHGQVVFGLKYQKNDVLQSVGYYFPELIVPESQEGYTMSCADLGDQTMSANMLSAHVLYSYIANILSGVEYRYMTLFDSATMGVFNKPISECPKFYPNIITGTSWRSGAGLKVIDG